MTTPSREEAPERVTLVMGEHGYKLWWLGSITNRPPRDGMVEYLRADLANREPSEGDVERIGRAVWAALSDSPLPDRDCQCAMEKAGLAAINAWRNL